MTRAWCAICSLMILRSFPIRRTIGSGRFRARTQPGRFRMSTASTQSLEFTLTLNEDERAQLLRLLEQEDRDTLVEAHRTDSPNYREHIERKESVLRGLIDKLRRR